MNGGRLRWTDVVGWAWLLAVAVFLVVFLLPRKGVDFSDEGWVLSASLSAARGWHLDTVVPQAPMWALNALLMSAGIESYIAMRWLFYGLISACLVVAFVALGPRHRLDGLQASLVTLGGLTTLSSLVSYNTTPPYLILAGVSLLVLAAEAQRRNVEVMLAVLSGLALSAGGFLNFTVYPAAAVSLGLAWMARGRPRAAWICAGTMVVVSGSAIAWYFHEIGLETFFRYPGGHGIDSSRIRTAIRIVLEWLAIGSAAWAATTFVMRRHSPDQRRRARQVVAAALVLGVSLFFASYLLYKLNLWTAGETLALPLHAARRIKLTHLGLLEQGLAAHVVALWGLAVLVLTTVLCRERDDVYRRVVLYGACLYTCYAFQEFFSLMDPRLIPIYYAGPCLAMGFYLLLRRPAGMAARLMGGAALAVTFAGSLAFSLHYNHPNLNPVLGRKVDVDVPKLVGLKESPERADTLRRLVEAFDEYRCSERTFVTFNATSVLYYLFEVEPQPGIEYLYVPQIFDADTLLRTLRESRGWCVFQSWNWLNWPTEASKPGTDAVMDYLRAHSSDVIRLSPRTTPVHPYDDFVVYLGPHR